MLMEKAPDLAIRNSGAITDKINLKRYKPFVPDSLPGCVGDFMAIDSDCTNCPTYNICLNCFVHSFDSRSRE